MTRKSIDPLIATDPAWADFVLERFDAFLPDHANCERKASALAMSLVVKYPDRHESIPHPHRPRPGESSGTSRKSTRSCGRAASPWSGTSPTPTSTRCFL